jgi:ATP-dependent Lon protease
MTRNNKPTLISNKKQVLKRNKRDPDTESDEESWDTETDTSETEISEEEVVSKKKTNRRRIIVTSSDSEESESDSDSDYDEEEEEEELDPREYKKFLAKMFPSKYISKRMDELSEESEKKSKKSKSKKSKKTKKSSKSKKQKKEESESEEEEYEESEEDESEEYDESEESESEKKSKKSKSKKSKKYSKKYESSDSSSDSDSDSGASTESEKKINIILSLQDEYDDYFGDENTDDDDDEDEECNSDDEQKFMKEKYEKVDVPKTAEEIKRFEREQKKKDRLASKKGKNTDNKSESVESEYLELLELKKDLSKKLLKNPKSKILKKAVTECTESIHKLVKSARKNNTKEYKSLCNFESKKPSEMTFFKKNLSNSEQLKIMSDLKEINKFIDIDKPYRLAILESKMPPKIKAHALQKLNILNSMDSTDPEFYKIKNWVDTFMRIPFCTYSNLSVNINDGLDTCHEFMINAKKSLDGCVYGLDDAKLQIMQMVGQWITNPDAMGTSIAIKGPPGTGKTTLVKDGISKILGREFVFIPLGGTGDASYLEGHSYTYEGSTWGKIVQSLINCKSMNPVFYFDELDKLSDTPKGEEITGILTHLTDTTQNSQFHDKYFSDIDFDLSKCLFIFSYNDEGRVNPILKDRMYRIQTKGYDAKEKIVIARNYMLPKIREQVNFSEEDVIIPDETLQYIISNAQLTQEESGVRNLKRCLEIIHTKLNLFRLMKPSENIFSKEMNLEVTFPFTVTKKHVDIFIKNNEETNKSLLTMYI